MQVFVFVKFRIKPHKTLSGIGEGEFDTLEKLDQLLKKALSMDIVEDVDTGAVAGFIMGFPTKLSRSFSPLHICKEHSVITCFWVFMFDDDPGQPFLNLILLTV